MEFILFQFWKLGLGYPGPQMWPGAGRRQLRTPGSVFPGQRRQRKAGELRLVALGTPGWVPSLPAPPPLCLCWKRALKWRNLTCHLLAKSSYPVPKVLSAWQSPTPKSWVHHSHPSSQSRLLQGKWALMRSRGGAGKALVNRKAELTQVGNGGRGSTPPSSS